MCINNGALFSQFASGLGQWVGEDTQPSWAIQDRHVRRINSTCEANFRAARGPEDKRQAALAGFANLLFWLGWLRSSEGFGLRWADIEVVQPSEGAKKELPPGVGCLLLRLKPQTKSNRTQTADLPIAYSTVSGHHIGLWWEHLTALQGDGGALANTDFSPIFQKATGEVWDSLYYRQRYVYPVLELMLTEGDQALRAATTKEGSTIPVMFHSLHMYRRGGRSHCDIVREKGAHHVRKRASPTQVYEHGRWRRKRGSEPIDIQYQAWTLFDHLQITLCSM